MFVNEAILFLSQKGVADLCGMPCVEAMHVKISLLATENR